MKRFLFYLALAGIGFVLFYQWVQENIHPIEVVTTALSMGSIAAFGLFLDVAYLFELMRDNKLPALLWVGTIILVLFGTVTFIVISVG